MQKYYLEYNGMGESGFDYFYKVADLKAWAEERYNAEVTYRPVENIHRETLKITWQQIIDKLNNS